MKAPISLAVGTFFLIFARLASAQTPATLTSLGAIVPTPGAADISQLSLAGETDKPDGLNYYTDNQADHNAGEPGQTFTTGTNPGGYLLSTLAFQTGGGTTSALATPKNYLLHIYSTVGGTATVIASYSAANFVYADGDWLQWSGLSVALAANSTYAYSFGKAPGGAGWDQLANAGGNRYAGGELGLMPIAGGAIVFGASHNFDGVFDIGLAAQNVVTAGIPSIAPTNNPVYAGTLVTLTEVATSQTPISYQWRTDGGSGGSRTNIPGANAANLAVNTSNLLAGIYHYDVIVTNSGSQATSAVAVVNFAGASPPFLVADIAPASAVAYFGGQQTFAATFNGTLPITYQWQAKTSSGLINISGATNSSLTLSNLQLANAGSYQLFASNSRGGPVASSLAALTVTNAPAAPTASVASAVLADNPVGFWRLNETSNTASGTVVAFDATQNFNGVYGAAAADGIPGPTPAIGYPGFENTNTAARFTNGAVNSYVTLPALNLNANTVTFTTWIYPNGTPANYAGIIFCRNGGDASGFCFTSDGQLGYTWNQNNQNTWGWLSGVTPPTGQWSFIALVISPTNAIVYLCNANGQISATNTVTHTAEAFSGSTLIGNDASDGAGGRTFNGVMDEVAIFNSSLSSVQILNLYFNGVGGAPRVAVPMASPSSTVFAGTTVALTASVAGLLPFQYQWQTNGVNFAGATNSTLVLPNATVASSGNYDVIVSNSSGTNQSPALALTVKPAGPPIITQQPAPAAITNYVGGLVTFTAGVDGSPPLSLQWQHNNSNILNATASTLTLAGLQTGDAGSYTLVVSNFLGVTNSLPVTLAILPTPNPGALNVLTYHNDNTRQGQNTNEVLLTLANVNVNTFGKLFTYPVDGHIYAQPLYVSGLTIPGQGVHNVVIVGTEHDSVYAFDADSNLGANGGLLWQTNLGISAVTPNNDFGNRYGPYHDLNPEMGITGTPVIDPVSGTLYLDAFTHDGASYHHRIHALNIANGVERTNVLVAAAIPGVGVDSTNGVLGFDAERSLNRCAMTLAGGLLYVTYTGYADTDPYHGWILGYNPANLQQLTNYIFNTSPNSTIADWGANAGECGIWMGGNGLSVDASNNLYFEVANGPFNANSNLTEYGDSFVKLATTNKLAVADYFTPFNQASLSSSDADLGSGGPLLLPDSAGSAAHPHLIVGCGKEGKIYLVDRDNMGHYSAANDNQIVESIGGAVGGTWSSPAYFNNFIYYLGSGDVLKAFLITNGFITHAPASASASSYGFPGATPAVSANGTNNGIVWAIQADAYGSGGPSILHAYNATNVAQEIYNSSQNLARDNPGGAVKMTVPTVVNGKVYVGAQFALSVYGNTVFLATPTIAPNGGIYTNSLSVTLADTTAGATIYYTLDGTTPTTNSLLYSGPLMLTNSVAIQAIAAKSGVFNSAVASAAFVNSSVVGSGIGLVGSYYASHTPANPFTGSPTLIRTNATINFNWNSAGPDPSIGQTNFTVRWTGAVQAQYNEIYTFQTITDDGVRLWINGQLLIDDFVVQGLTTNTASIPLKAGELYNVEMDYFQGTGGAAAQLAWSSPSTASAIIPQSQLYPYTNPPPGIVLISPSANASYTASASVTLSATAAAQYNNIDHVTFYANNTLLGSISNVPYMLTVTGLAAGNYALIGVATDGSGLTSTSAVVNIVVNPGSGLPYGLGTRAPVPAFLNMPPTFNGALPALLSQAGVFADTPGMVPATGLIPYSPNTPLWSDGAVKTRWLALPYDGGLETPDQQISFAATGEWAFPTGAIFVKHFALVTDETNPNAPLRRLETRLIVRDPNGAVYGVTYKWRPDNSDADLLTGSLSENILITNATGVRTQVWYYPSPSDCLTCHTPAANYVLGLKTRQLNGNFSYPSGVTDNQLRAFNHLGLFNPGIDEAQITNYAQLVSVTNLNASLTNRFRSYIDANCSQCHRPGGTGISFDARYDTPLANQNIINGAVLGNLGYDNAHVVTPRDIWRSMLYQRANSLDPLIKMPPLARNLADTNALAVIAAWINGLPGTLALAPPTLTPAGGTFNGSVNITVLPPDTNSVIYYTLDGSLPTTNSLVYTGPIVLTNSATVNANAFESGFNNSVAANGVFTILPGIYFTANTFSHGVFQLQLSATPNQSYVLQASTNLIQWVSISTNTPATSPFSLTDANATNFATRFYRVLQLP